MLSFLKQISIKKFMFSAKKPSLRQIQDKLAQGKRIQYQKRHWYYHIGMYGLVFACCFAAIPLYRVFCEHVGLLGNNDKKQYDFKEKQVTNLKKFIVKFNGQAQPGINWDFDSVEKQVIVGAAETAIVFYRLYNKQNYPIVGFSTYNISPQQANVYFSKIQCFCFNQQMVNPKQQLLLPLFFYLQPQINEDFDVSRIKQVTVNYQFFKSNKQEIAQFAQEEIRKMEENKMKLNMMRAKKKNMTLVQYQEYLQRQQNPSINDDTFSQLSTHK